MKMLLNYEAPSVEIIGVEVEQFFAQSPYGRYGTPDDGYSENDYDGFFKNLF